MTGKQITELDAASGIDDGDLMLVRKSGAGEDKSITRAKFVESIGNSAVQGYVAESEAANKITLQASNAALIPKYYEGMKVSFISPIVTTDIVQVQVGTLQYIDLQKYSLDETVTLSENEYVEAVYSKGVFKQTNNLNTHLIWSNEYTAKAIINPEATITVYNLTSAVGVKKTSYYTGMSLLFTVPENSKGVVFVNVDGLGNKELGESGGSLIAKDVYENHAIMAIYDGKQFVKQKFSTIHTKPLVVDEPPVIQNDDIIDAPITPAALDAPVEEPIDIWAEDYPGDLDDPANTTTPNALDSHGLRMFDKIVTVGSSGIYKSLESAISGLVNDYGDDGGGHRFAIEIDSSFRFALPRSGSNKSVLRLHLQGKTKSADLRWITIFVKNNAVLQCTEVNFDFRCKFSPILNFKMSSNTAFGLSIFFGSPSQAAQITFGRNTEITFQSTYPATPLIGYPVSIEAKYGIKIRTNGAINIHNAVINKGTFVYTPSHHKTVIDDHMSYRWGLFVGTRNSSVSMYNSEITLEYNKAHMTDRVCKTHKIFSLNHNSELYLKNVSSVDRIGKLRGINAVGNNNITLENCNFASETEGSACSGYDIVIRGTGNELYLNNTTGNTNHPVNQQTPYGIIHKS